MVVELIVYQKWVVVRGGATYDDQVVRLGSGSLAVSFARGGRARGAMADGIDKILEGMRGLKGSYDMGVISEEEYNKLRKPMMEQLTAATATPTPTGTTSLVAAAEGSAAGAGGALAGGSGSANPAGTQLRPQEGARGADVRHLFALFSHFLPGPALLAPRWRRCAYRGPALGSVVLATHVHRTGAGRAPYARVCARLRNERRAPVLAP